MERDEHDALPNTAAYLTERDTLPEPLRPDFDALVRAYRFYSLIHYKQPFISYKILADLIRDGWRESAEPLDSNR